MRVAMHEKILIAFNNGGGLGLGLMVRLGLLVRLGSLVTLGLLVRLGSLVRLRLMVRLGLEFVIRLRLLNVVDGGPVYVGGWRPGLCWGMEAGFQPNPNWEMEARFMLGDGGRVST